MNKTAIKNFSIWARNKLISDIQFRAQMLGVLPDGIREPLPQSEKETQFFDIGTKDYAVVKGNDVYRRAAFVEALRAKARKADYDIAYKTVIEKIAYTWFNRLIAIRFMEVNDYLPGQVRVLSSRMAGKAEPDIVSTPFDSDLEFTSQEQDTIMQLKDDNKLDDLFRMMFISQCHKLSEILPGLFVPKENAIPPREYYELLLNINFTDQDGLVWHLVHDIPAATQLFTPDWIVRYMVQNSLGRLWVEGHPDTKERFMPEHNADGSVCVQEGRWNYYLEEAKQEPQVEVQLAAIREEYASLRPEDIQVIDPCCGSGHIAVYLFDVLMQIYETQGWTQREAAQSIVEHNLYALDIDDRAAQLAYFAVMMKARQYDRRFFTRGLQPHVYAIPEWDEETRKGWSAELRNLCNLLRDGKEFGSIIDMPEMDWNDLRMEVELMADMQGQISIDSVSEATRQKLRRLIDVGQVMAQKYDVVVTNPPYMGSGGMGERLSKYVKDYYSDSKSDMSTVCMERCMDLCSENGYMAMINIPVWMFLSSYEKLRYKQLNNNTYINMVHPGRGIFGSDFGTTTFVMAKRHIPCYTGSYRRLFDKQGEVETIERREQQFLSGKGVFVAQQDKFIKIPGAPVAYWVGQNFINAYSHELCKDLGTARSGLQTGNNNLFLKLWYEVSLGDIAFGMHTKKEYLTTGLKWTPQIKGGNYRKWYGNLDYIVNWENDGEEIRKCEGCRLNAMGNDEFFYIEGITWSHTTAGVFGARYLPNGVLFNVEAPTFFVYKKELLLYILGLFNSKVIQLYLNVINSTLHYLVGNILTLPVLLNNDEKEYVEKIVLKCINDSRVDWDSFETSWDFQHHPLLDVISRSGPFFERGCIDLAECWLLWKGECEERFQQLKANEEELNRIFIDIYGLQDELTPEVEDKEVTVRRADLGRDIRSLISYAVGCMFGRYSLDVPGLAYAGGVWDKGKYHTYLPDDDNCLPITDEDYGMKDDVINRFVDFIRTVYGEATLETNLDFIAHALGNKGDTSRDVIRNYFLNDFFKDHCSTYSVTGSGKRPIYWLFDSGKANGFKALVYMHRWNADTVGNLRVECLHRMQRVYEKEIERMQDTMDNGRDSRDVARATKRREKLVKQLKEARDYDAKIAHVALSRVEIDLDDGVKVNYEKVQKGPDGKSLGILAKL